MSDNLKLAELLFPNITKTPGSLNPRGFNLTFVLTVPARCCFVPCVACASFPGDRSVSA